MDFIIVIAVVALVTPLALRIASKQDRDSKNKLRAILWVLLLGEFLSGLLDWETFDGAGRSGLKLALTYPSTFLWMFFVVAFVQIILLSFRRPTIYATVATLNFVNTIIVFIGMIMVSNIIGRQIVSPAGIAAIFLALIGNVVGLLLANKDKNLIAKSPY